MKKLSILFATTLLILLSTSQILFAELEVYPGLPADTLKSTKYGVQVRQGGDYVDSYVYEYIKNYGSDATLNDPYNISNAGKRNALTDANHWTTFSFDGNNVEVQVTLASGDISSCEVFPKSSGIEAVIADGKATLTIDDPLTKLYLLVNNNKKHPLFIFADPMEESVPSEGSADVLYYGPGMHNIGLNYTPATTIKTIYIAGGAYVQGNIYTNNRSDITVRGRGILSGGGIKFNPNNTPDAHIYFNGSGSNQLIEGITIMKPIHYHVLSRGTFDVDNIKCFSWNNTTDGWGGGDASTCRNSFFKVNDDVFKIYDDDQVIEDNMVYFQTNGLVCQFGWSGQNAQNCRVENIEIVEDNQRESTYPTSEYHPIVGWTNANSALRHTGHKFIGFTADNGVGKLLGFDMDQAVQVDIRIQDWKIKSYKEGMIYSVPSGGSIDVDFYNVKVNGQCVSDDDVKEETGNITLSYLSCTSVDAQTSFAESNEPATFPVPFHDELWIDGLNPDYSYSVKIIGLSGEVIKETQVQNEGIINLVTSDLANGFYLIQIQHEQQITTLKTFKTRN